jgi:hypothetical protein
MLRPCGDVTHQLSSTCTAYLQAHSIAVATQETQSPTVAISQAATLDNSDATAVSETLNGQAVSEALAAGNSQATAVSQAVGGTAFSQAIASTNAVDSEFANTAGVDLLDPDQLTSALCCKCDKAAPTAEALAQAIATGGGCGSSAGVALARKYTSAMPALALSAASKPQHPNPQYQ